MPRQLTAQELASVREAETAEAARLAHRQEITGAIQPGPGQVKLYDKKRDRLAFGGGSARVLGPGQHDSLIQFGETIPGVAIVRADHPLLSALLRRHPHIIVLEPGEEIGRTYVCDTCDREFKSKRSLSNHRKEAHPAPPAPRKRAADDPAHATPPDDEA